MPQNTAPGLLLEGGWRPAHEPETAEEAVLAQTVQDLLPKVEILLWNVRNDLSVLDMAEIMVERMRLLGPASFWRRVEVLQRRLEAARESRTSC